MTTAKNYYHGEWPVKVLFEQLPPVPLPGTAVFCD